MKKKVTLPNEAVLSSAEFNRHESISHAPDNDSILENQIYQYRPNINARTTPERQRLVLHNGHGQGRIAAVQRIEVPLRAPPLSLQSTLQKNTITTRHRRQQQQQDQQKQEISYEMETTATTYIQVQQNLPSECLPIISEALTTATGPTQITPTATASPTIFSAHDLAVENVMPGIYLTKNFTAWNEENLRSHAFTHIIIIDKLIQELYYPSPVFKLSTENTMVDAFDTYEYVAHPACSSSLKFGKEFEAIDLNFGEKSYLTTVLPNCYRAVKFINKALQAGGTILVIDCNGGEQKCITIIVAYLMYKHNIKFSDAFARLKNYYKKADLDRFYMTQLYEYEPILQVQRTQSRGQSCSREMYSSILKRKKTSDDVGGGGSDCDGSSNNNITDTSATTTSEFFNNFNPLSNFIATTATPSPSTDINFKATSNEQLTQMRFGCCASLDHTSKQHSNFIQTAGAFTGAGGTADYHAWDDNAME